MAQLDDLNEKVEAVIGQVANMTPEDLAAGAELAAEAVAGQVEKAVGDAAAAAELAAEALADAAEKAAGV